MEREEGRETEVKGTDNGDISLLIEMRIIQQQPRGGHESRGAHSAELLSVGFRLSGCLYTGAAWEESSEPIARNRNHFSWRRGASEMT